MSRSHKKALVICAAGVAVNVAFVLWPISRVWPVNLAGAVFCAAMFGRIWEMASAR